MKENIISYLLLISIMVFCFTLGISCGHILDYTNQTTSIETTEKAVPIDSEWTCPGLAGAATELPNFVAVVEKVKPSVVVVETESAVG